MVFGKRVSALVICGVSLLASPALAGPSDPPGVIPGMGPGEQGDMAPEAAPSNGRYGGGFIEFLMTGRSGHPAARQQAMRQPVEQEPDYGFEPAQQPYPQAPYPQGVRPVPGYAAPRKAVDPMFVRQDVPYAGPQTPGTIVIDTKDKFLYLVQGGGHALRYGIGVGRPGFLWAGEKTITRKAEWPGWTPPPEMLQRRPDLPGHMDGGITNPLGARAMYLGSSLYRIHGTNEPDTIGTNVSSGCIRLTNDDVADLYSRVQVGTHVIVM